MATIFTAPPPAVTAELPLRPNRHVHDRVASLNQEEIDVSLSRFAEQAAVLFDRRYRLLVHFLDQIARPQSSARCGSILGDLGHHQPPFLFELELLGLSPVQRLDG